MKLQITLIYKHMEKRNYEQAKHEKFTEICSMS